MLVSIQQSSGNGVLIRNHLTSVSVSYQFCGIIMDCFDQGIPAGIFGTFLYP